MDNKKQIRLTESDLHRIVKESVDKILNEMGGQEPVSVNSQQPQINNAQPQQQPQQSQQHNNQLTPFQQGIQKWCQQAAAKIMNIEKVTNAIWQTLQYQQRGQQYRR